jgi:hypothetical protein
LSAAKELADATARMVEAAKMCASRPTDRESQVITHEKIQNRNEMKLSDI